MLALHTFHSALWTRGKAMPWKGMIFYCLLLMSEPVHQAPAESTVGWMYRTGCCAENVRR